MFSNSGSDDMNLEKSLFMMQFIYNRVYLPMQRQYNNRFVDQSYDGSRAQSIPLCGLGRDHVGR